ncbi:MAG: PH domain-containing protein [Steroidobacteraceae bacterium]
MSYLTSTLIPGEAIVYQTRLHWIVMLTNLVTALALFAIGGTLLWYLTTHPGFDRNTVLGMQITSAALLACGLIALLAGGVRRNATEMAVTNRRVVVKTGLVRRKTIEMLLNKVESIEVRETTWGRILGFGAIIVVGTGGSTEPFANISHPIQFRSRLQQQIERMAPLRAEPAVVEQPVVTSAPAVAPVAPATVVVPARAETVRP